MWIIASIPFWIIGGIAMAGGLTGVYGEVSRNDTDSETWPAFLLLMLIAASAFYLAARIAS